MSKKIKVLMIAAAVIIVLSVVLAGCQSYKWGPVTGGDPNAAVTSNGGYAVQQGNHLYFINGKTGFPSSPDNKYNYFGKIEKGSIMRATIVNGELTDYQIVVPKNVMTSYAGGGFSIFGEWIYYVSPTTKTNNKGVLETNYLDYMRTKIDGTKTQLIATLEGQSLPYKFTESAFVYYLNYTLYSIPYDAKKVGRQITLAEDVTSYLLPESTSYVSGTTNLEDYIYYTTPFEEENLPGSELFVTNADGTMQKKLIGREDYLEEDQDPYENRDRLYAITLHQYRTTATGIELYYQKSKYEGSTNRAEGVFGVQFGTDLKYEIEKEVRFSVGDSLGTSYFPLGLDTGLLKIQAEPQLYMPIENLPGTPENYLDTETFKNLGSVTMLFVKEVDGIDYMYYIASSKLMRAPFPLSGTVEENAEVISGDATIDTSWFKPDLVGDYFYFIDTTKLNYTVRIALDGSILDEDGKKVVELIGQMTKDDAETWEEMNKED